MRSIETKRRIIEMARERRPLLIFQHDPDRPLGRLVHAGTRLKVEPVAPEECDQP